MIHQTVAWKRHAVVVAEDLIGHSCRPLASLWSPRSGGAFFLNAPLRLWPADKEVLQDIASVIGGERLLARCAMDQAIREVRVRFHAHDLVARSAPGADEINRMALSHAIPRPTPLLPGL
jgi:hypothetical protein